MKFRLEVEMDGQAFEGHPEMELSRMLREVADRIVEFWPEYADCAAYPVTRARVVMDANGNAVGKFRFTGKRPGQ